MAKNTSKAAGGPGQTRIVLIGRAAGNDLVLRQPSVSARHARVLVGPDDIWIEDLGSRNGTFVGTPPRRVERERITLDDPLVFGDAALPATALRDFLERTQPRPADEGVIHLDDAALVTFGRSAGASVALDQPLVSALHASVAVDRGRVVVRDLGSTAGTFVDGRRIERPVEISPGTLVQVGDQRYRLSNDARALEPVDTSADAVEAVQVAVEASGRRLLEGVSLVIHPGEMVAIMGPSGAGKSTLVDLLPRFLDPTAGRITLDGVDLREFRLDAVRALTGIVSQDTVLFNDTVRANVAYGRPDATLAQLTAAARAANALAFIEALPQGWDTNLGERGTRLSGGQRQRLAIARALLSDPPILILDEATSALDAESERLVQEAIDRLLAGRTVFVIAHRLATIQHADRILVLEGGRLAEAGTHAELLARGGAYARLHALQFDRATLAPAPTP